MVDYFKTTGKRSGKDIVYSTRVNEELRRVIFCKDIYLLNINTGHAIYIQVW